MRKQVYAGILKRKVGWYGLSLHHQKYIQCSYLKCVSYPRLFTAATSCSPLTATLCLADKGYNSKSLQSQSAVAIAVCALKRAGRWAACKARAQGAVWLTRFYWSRLREKKEKEEAAAIRKEWGRRGEGERPHGNVMSAYVILIVKIFGYVYTVYQNHVRILCFSYSLF